jgi:hypothetical protein
VAELVLDDSVLYNKVQDPEEHFSVERPVMDNRQNSFTFQYFHALERLSIKNVTWGLHENDFGRPVSQGMLIKMVCHHPTLKWLRSNLKEENIVMRRQERPDITFVRE